MNDSQESAQWAAALLSPAPDRASVRLPAYREDGAAAQLSNEAETSEAEGALVQLSLFPAPAQAPQLCAPLFHVRCPDCRAVNDVPSLPTLCYVCGLPLGREERW